MIGTVDSCFLIDWSRYRKRDLLPDLFEALFMHEEILSQLRSPVPTEYVSHLLSRGILRLYPWSSREEIYIELRDQISLDPRIPSLERPDLLCLVIALRTGSTLLTENLGIIRVVQFHPRCSGVDVWTSLEVLEQLAYRGSLKVGSVDDFLRRVAEYEEDTGHLFSRRRLDDVVKRVRKWLGE